MKLCCRCNTEKPLEMFVKSSRSKGGYGSRCKACHCEISKKSAKENQQSRKDSSDRYYANHKKECSERSKSWQKSNPVAVKEIRKRARIKNAESIRKYVSEFGVANQRKMRLKYPEKFKARNFVNNNIAKGRLERAKNLTCAHCGKQASDYHHHNGYSREHWLDVIPLCRPCHVMAG